MARIIAAVACLTALLALASAEDMMKMKVPVTVYYESLCPDSMKFFHEQLHPTWMNLSMYLDLTLVPFGRATYNMTADGNYTFECKHGERECEGDRVHICAIQKTPQSDYMKLINCAMDMSRDAKNNSAPYSGLGKQCADSVGMTGYAQTIEKCVMEESDKLFAEMGNKTWELNPKLESVPAIVFKNEYKPSEQSKYRSDFKMAVCSMIMGDKPDVCKTPAKGSAGNLVPEMAVSVSLAVISTILSRM